MPIEQQLSTLRRWLTTLTVITIALPSQCSPWLQPALNTLEPTELK